MGRASLGFIGWQKPTLYHLKFSQHWWQEKITESAKLWALLQEFGFFSSDGPFQADIKAIETRAVLWVAKGKKWERKKERKKNITILF